MRTNSRDRSLRHLPDFAYAGDMQISLSALEKNYARFRRWSAPAICAAVVKADAYGLGLEPVVRCLAKAGCQHFFVATMGEAAMLRRLQPKADIYVLNGLPPGAGAWAAERQIMPCLGSLSEIAEWQATTKAQQAPSPACLHIDTGMNRLGLSQHDCTSLQAEPACIEFPIALIMSHLACADEADAPMNQAQQTCFIQRCAQLPRAPTSLANSAGVFLGKDYHFDMVRVGIGLYGGLNPPPQGGTQRSVVPVVSLYAPIIALRELSAGETVGYGASYKASAPLRIALVSIGYGDGYLRSLGAGHKPFAMAHIGTTPVPIIGRVSMDILAIDISTLGSKNITRGTMVELLGKHTQLVPLAVQAGTIPYEILTRLGVRCKRHYKN